jgi:hypothetical protein
MQHQVSQAASAGDDHKSARPRLALTMGDPAGIGSMGRCGCGR